MEEKKIKTKIDRKLRIQSIGKYVGILISRYDFQQLLTIIIHNKNKKIQETIVAMMIDGKLEKKIDTQSLL